jgi:hypothetical protein
MIKLSTEFFAWEESQFNSFMETHEEINATLKEISFTLKTGLNIYMQECGYKWNDE